MIAAMIPHVAIVNSAPLMVTDELRSERSVCCLLANLNSVCLDYVSRQKVGGVHLNFFIINQLPLFPPDTYAQKCPWEKRRTLENWISDRVLKLTCAADDMRPLAEAARFAEGVHKWRDEERSELMAELDAAFLILYGLSREESEFLLGTFGDQASSHDKVPLMNAQDKLVLSHYDQFHAKTER